MQRINTRYTLVSQLPLLQGITRWELFNWEDFMQLDIDEYPASVLPIINQDDPCSKLICLIEGQLLREHRSPDGHFSTRSDLRAPAVIEVDRLFGLNPTYENTYWAKTEVKMLGIPKNLLGSLLMKNEVFRLNLLNTLSAIAQKKAAALLPVQLNNVEERLRHFVGTLFQDCEGEVELFIMMNDIARYIGDSRLIVSRLLNRLHEERSIRLGRGHFTIHDIKAFINKHNSPTSLIHHVI